MPPTAVAPEVPTLVLEPSGRAPSLARRFVADRLREWGIADDSDARVVVSELVTNSLQHGEGPIVVRVLRDERDGRPVIETWDGGQGLPEIRPEDHAATSGRGLLMVSQLALDWGTRPLLEGGKLTWAKC
ncbi:ATP-binding protein [Actinomadura sp. 6K520]|uniref:ATP-binding protein n=1 Tax=Actinomadura sp. 6K520 TaxID=2530364 RepID=UPI001052501D|nr:ATP-binding protein [Actinomadura sp. 6K520]TDE33770.1 sensor histidine kinase [Actinomadura sp. 6K520]